MLFELLRPLSVPNFKFWRIHLTRVDQYAKEKLILKADFEFGILWATLPMGLCALLNNLFSYLIWFFSFPNRSNNNLILPNANFWLNWQLGIMEVPRKDTFDCLYQLPIVTMALCLRNTEELNNRENCQSLWIWK